jgi:hypothetical protein
MTGLISAALLLAGCGTVEKDKRALGLQAATSGYQSSLRWGYFETAYGYVHPDQRKGKDLPEMYKNLRLTGYDVVQPPLVTGEEPRTAKGKGRKEPTEATQVVAIEYLHEDRQVIKTLTDRQIWRYDPKLESWWLDSGLPKFK